MFARPKRSSKPARIVSAAARLDAMSVMRRLPWVGREIVAGGAWSRIGPSRKPANERRPVKLRDLLAATGISSGMGSHRNQRWNDGCADERTREWVWGQELPEEFVA